MCGIVGLLKQFDAEATLDLAPVERALTALRDWTVDARDAGDRLLEIASGLERLSRGLIDWHGFRTLLDQPRSRELTAQVGAALREAAEAVDARLDDPSRVASSSEGEALSRGAVLARDVAWRCERDALPNVEAVQALARAGQQTGLKGWFELWRVNLVLNQLARLEVRGRDSGGLATLVRFDAAGWAQAQAALSAAGLDDELARRAAIPELRDLAILTCAGPDGGQTLAFAHKVAKEVGELGANVRELREALHTDAVYQLLVGHAAAQVQVMAHTRWASNGIISEPNCHPVANDLSGDAPLGRILLAVLNGDVDNYPQLAPGHAIPPACTTDAKIIPLEIDRHMGDADTAEAVRRAVESFTGSTAIAVIGDQDVERVHVAQRGSGQAIYVGVLDAGGYLFASELYGVVELAPRFYKLDGEAGELVHLRAAEGLAGLERKRYDGTPRPLQASDLKQAAIATRDIDRGGFPHYLLKEISEAPRSVERTLRGKFVLEDPDTKHPRFLLGADVIPPALRVLLTERRLQRVFVIGQGTAAVAGQAAAEYMATLLRPAGIEVIGMPATELSGYQLDALGSDCLVVAVSQSGTTTDTNRTVDLARQRGALVIGIVNRRGSDLADKAHGVLYTSDGRDVEMSVASTKAFYCQVVAGYLLALQLGRLAGTVSGEDLKGRLLRLLDLPRCLREVLHKSRDRIRQAALLALRRRHWTVVGSGPVLHAAREIRIKISELCYKSVPVDTIEDKKHIDLSSEAMILVCAAGLTGPAAADAVKEVAIFKAHAASTVVICDVGETRFADYAEATITVPATTPEVSLLLNTMAGHLFGYETALAIDARTAPLLEAREACESTLEAIRAKEQSAPAPRYSEQAMQRLRVALAPACRTAFAQVAGGDWNAGLAPSATYRLLSALRVGLGQAPFSELRPGKVPPALSEDLELLISELSTAIDQLRRPIDAIKHQAKTVTVGISRDEDARTEAGPLERALVDAGVDSAALADQDVAALAALGPVVAEVAGVVHYALEHLDALGAPTPQTTIKVLTKTGVAAELTSRADEGALLRGTKRMLVRSPRVWVGRGQRDGRSLIACPVYTGGMIAGICLIHTRFAEQVEPRQRARALRAAGRYEDLKCLVTELDVPWSTKLLDGISIDRLLTRSLEHLAEEIAAGHTGSEQDASSTAALVSPFLTPGSENGGRA